MTIVEKILELCKIQGIPISKLERDCGFANGYIKRLKGGAIPSDRLKPVADYLGVSINYLLGIDDYTPIISTERKTAYSMIDKMSEDDVKKTLAILQIMMGDN